MQKDEEVGKVAQATPIVICTRAFFPCVRLSWGQCSLSSSESAGTVPRLAY